ncbi:hypothetical protein CLV58_113132 [Spirosoma oryzae]|uniref:Uncharacterized protein n=1 Tax=Spirosoma oryzae TaxID=1469603 RepID=A0A2T0SRF3_9BACT|nr:hypothetical protein [Spirosoma oryzae]PRY36001.1 hypothetical protein CLV58_113132 [Spirosoma oryzae]
MAKQTTKSEAAPATPLAETLSAISTPVDATSPRTLLRHRKPPGSADSRSAPANSRANCTERLIALSDNSPYLEQQQLAVKALSKLRTAQMWEGTADMWANIALNFG